ncbi:MAG: hypothetical protein AMS24_04700 [Chlamydiae bacterium SM23_39]|nr:MAG: hypothetical protein AMS24_04700 [Chlamydiae bacterium SM23_39]
MLKDKIIFLREEKKTIATLNGSFDLLHAGHLKIIYEASLLADVLFILLNTDKSIKAYKGEKRPIISLEYRIQMVTALEFVDFVSWFDETTPIKILKKIKPDVHVNGEEYGENCIEKKIVEKYGKLHLVKKDIPLSSSKIIEKIRCDL